MSEKKVKKTPKAKVDPELRAKISRMEKEKRDKEVKKVAPKKEVLQGVSFKRWWAAVSKKLELPAYLKEIVWADFNSRGLSKVEEKSKYDKALELFGYKL